MKYPLVRVAHHIVGLAVRQGEEKGLALTELTPEDWQAISPLIGKDVAGVLTVPAALAARAVSGGTAPAALEAQLTLARQTMGR